MPQNQHKLATGESQSVSRAIRIQLTTTKVLGPFAVCPYDVHSDVLKQTVKSF